MPVLLPRARVFFRTTLLFLSSVAGFSADRPYIAVIEKAAGAVGFYRDEGRQSGLVKIGPVDTAQSAAIARNRS